MSDGTDLGRDILAKIGHSPFQEQPLRTRLEFDNSIDEDIDREAGDVSYNNGGPGADHLRPSLGEIINQPRKSLVPSCGALTQPDYDVRSEDQ